MVGNIAPNTSLIVSSITELAPDFKMISFADGHGIDYASGQYLTLIDKVGQNEIRRSYSILSLPFLNEPLSIGVKRIENGYFSRKLADRTHIGDAIVTNGAGGFFKLPDNMKEIRYIVLFAAGSGITPIYSILRAALYQHENVKIILFYSNHSSATTALFDQLNSLVKLFHHQLIIHFFFSNSKELKSARLTRDHLIEFVHDHRSKLEHSLFFACGPESYMMKVVFVLVEMGVSKDRIRKEEFVNYKTRQPKQLPPDKFTGIVEIQYREKRYKLEVNYPETILESAKKNNLTLPYSCETGKCGSCVATCIQGRVWMSNNEVLTDADLGKRFILTCVGHPQTDLKIKIP